MTCKEIYNLHAFRAKESDLHDAYWDVPLDSRDETILLCIQPAILQT